jgi:hypothetical protein
LPDPAAAVGEAAQRDAFAATAQALEQRLDSLLALGQDALADPAAWQRLQAPSAPQP